MLYGNGYSEGRTINAGALRHVLGQQRLSSNLVPRERKLLEGGQEGRKQRTQVITSNLEFLLSVHKVASLPFISLFPFLPSSWLGLDFDASWLCSLLEKQVDGNKRRS